jgi:cytochrome P450
VRRQPQQEPRRPWPRPRRAAANRDPARFDEPERLDITRDDPPAMLTFGGGVHHCLGAHLARVELAEALTVLARRMPNLRRTGPAPWKSIFDISGPTTLPITFDAN